MVAERGNNLSGCQKQRLSIARAVVKDAEILIFDDSTSALDLKTEAQLYDALNQTCPHTTNLLRAIILILSVYLLYSACQLFQGLISAKISQRLVKQMREELFGKMIDLPVQYLDTHSHGDVMSNCWSCWENTTSSI